MMRTCMTDASHRLKCSDVCENRGIYQTVCLTKELIRMNSEAIVECKLQL